MYPDILMQLCEARDALGLTKEQSVKCRERILCRIFLRCLLRAFSCLQSSAPRIYVELMILLVEYIPQW